MDRIYAANVSPGSTSVHFTKSFRELAGIAGALWQESGANISKGRNELVQTFLDGDGDWLLFLDSDMVFPPDTALRLLAAADKAGCQIIGGLCVMVGALGPVPTLYQFDDVPGSDGITRVQFDYPDNALLQVAATGCACLMVHRDVFEDLRVGGYGWFKEQVLTHPETGREHWTSEDIGFCLAAVTRGHRIFVDTTLQIGHAKHGRIWYASDIRDGIGIPRGDIAAVIPTKTDDLVDPLIDQLLDQGVRGVVVCDNGLRSRRKDHRIVYLDSDGQGIHEMWNRGIETALGTWGERTKIALLNDDLILGPNCLRTLGHALDDYPEYLAVSPNYDGRNYPEPVQQVTDICANRYDGTGGLAGFAFMVRGEFFTSGYRFPETCKWWYGDNDFVQTVAISTTDDSPKKLGIVVAATVEHLDGGGKTGGDWSEYAEQIEADRAAFEAKWAPILAPPIPAFTPTDDPFPHHVGDGWWDERLLQAVLAEFPDPEQDGWRRYGNEHEGKLEGPPHLWGPATKYLFGRIAQAAPILAEAFAIPDLSMEVVGGGYHLIPPGGHLDMHTDFSRSPDTGLYRRLNFLIYLNQDWDDEGGSLYLDTVEVPPEFNRTAVFATSSRSWHGHPKPAHRWRYSVAAYFFSPEPPEGFVEQSTVWQADA